MQDNITMQRFIRSLSTKAAKSHTPPVKIYGLAGKYAEATYIAASKVSFYFSLINQIGAFFLKKCQVLCSILLVLAIILTTSIDTLIICNHEVICFLSWHFLCLLTIYRSFIVYTRFYHAKLLQYDVFLRLVHWRRLIAS